LRVKIKTLLSRRVHLCCKKEEGKKRRTFSYLFFKKGKAKKLELSAGVTSFKQAFLPFVKKRV